LENVARAAGTSKSAIVRLLTETFVDQVVSHGRVTLPPDWADLLPRRDERAGSKALSAAIADGARLNDESAPPVQAARTKVNYKRALKTDAAKTRKKGKS